MNQHETDYAGAFGDPFSECGRYPKDSRLAKAYEVALDIRKFEIELYWKRSASFWLLVGGIAAALGLLLSGKADAAGSAMLSPRSREIISFILCMSGAVICYAWGLVNEGSKFWQRNWEYQVGILEQQVLGPLYKTVMSSKKSDVMYSVSRLNGYISNYFCCIFAIASFGLLIGQDGQSLIIERLEHHIDNGTLAFCIKLLIVLAHIWLVWKLKSSGQRRTDESNFDSEVEVSVRQITIDDKIFGNPDSKRIWNKPVSNTDTDTDNYLSKLRKLLQRFGGLKSDKP